MPTLVVEDDTEIRDILVELLRDEGATVVEARDGLEAASRLDELKGPSLILLDLMMPRMSGWEFLEVLSRREDANRFSVIVLSASLEATREIVHPRVVDVVRKPFEVGDLLERIEAVEKKVRIETGAELWSRHP